ncbi:MAG: hypothetical protein N3D84_01640 [Candidatus Woesearchaeota archaeon]|nr:hypothetical protein [Candidatus Woesearchaeota archaeon]
MRIRLSQEERGQRWKEARRGWASTKEMTALEHAALRERRRREYLKKKEEEERKREEMSRSAKQPMLGKRRFRKVKLLIFIVVIGVLVYVYLKYFR